MSEREQLKPSEQDFTFCEEIHKDEFSLKTAREKEDELRSSLKHLITERHRFGEKIIGGYKAGPELYEELSGTFFRTAGFLKTFTLGFKGNSQLLVDFVWPDGFELKDDKTEARIEQAPALIDKLSTNLWDQLSEIEKANLTEAFFKNPKALAVQVDAMSSFLDAYRKGEVETPTTYDILQESSRDAKKDLAAKRLKSLASLSIINPNDSSIRTVVGWGRQINDITLMLGGGSQATEALFETINSLDDVTRALVLSQLSMSKRYEIMKVGMDQVNEREMAFFINSAIYTFNKSGDPGDVEEIIITTMERDQSVESFSATRVLEYIIENYSDPEFIFRQLIQAAKQQDFGGNLMDFFFSHQETQVLGHRLARIYGEETNEIVPRNRRL